MVDIDLNFAGDHLWKAYDLSFVASFDDMLSEVSVNFVSDVDPLDGAFLRDSRSHINSTFLTTSPAAGCL